MRLCDKDQQHMDRLSLIAICCLIGWPVAAPALAQQSPIHYFHNADLPPGRVGRDLAHGRVALQGYFQPVKLLLPSGARVSLQADGHFETPQSGPVVIGMQVGALYRLKVTSIPLHEGFEVYPTVEVVNRLYPPPNQQLKFPVPIELTLEELELALSGQMVTRVVYLEDPATALAYADAPDRQRYFDVAGDEDPLRAADRLGRPLAILRMGSRLPDLGDGGGDLGFGSPPLLRYTPEQLTAPSDMTEAAIERYGFDIPRIPLRGAPAAPPHGAGGLRR